MQANCNIWEHLRHVRDCPKRRLRKRKIACSWRRHVCQDARDISVAAPTWIAHSHHRLQHHHKSKAAAKKTLQDTRVRACSTIHTCAAPPTEIWELLAPAARAHHSPNQPSWGRARHISPESRLRHVSVRPAGTSPAPSPVVVHALTRLLDSGLLNAIARHEFRSHPHSRRALAHPAPSSKRR
jgi:hypothetical protein